MCAQRCSIGAVCAYAPRVTLLVWRPRRGTAAYKRCHVCREQVLGAVPSMTGPLLVCSLPCPAPLRPHAACHAACMHAGGDAYRACAAAAGCQPAAGCGHRRHPAAAGGGIRRCGARPPAACMHACYCACMRACVLLYPRGARRRTALAMPCHGMVIGTCRYSAAGACGVGVGRPPCCWLPAGSITTTNQAVFGLGPFGSWQVGIDGVWRDSGDGRTVKVYFNSLSLKVRPRTLRCAAMCSPQASRHSTA